MQFNWIPLLHRQGPILEWPQNFHDIYDNGPVILCCEKWRVIAVLWSLEPHWGELSESVGLSKPLQCRVPMYLNICIRLYGDADFGIFRVNQPVSTNRYQCKHYSKHSLRQEGQFQNIQNILKCVLSQLSLLNLVSWPTPCWFEHSPPVEVFDSSKHLCFRSRQTAEHAHVLPMTWCGLLQPDYPWMQLKPAVWRAPWMVCGSSMQTTLMRKPQVLIAAHESSSNLRKHFQG